MKHRVEIDPYFDKLADGLKQSAIRQERALSEQHKISTIGWFKRIGSLAVNAFDKAAESFSNLGNAVEIKMGWDKLDPPQQSNQMTEAQIIDQSRRGKSVIIYPFR